MSTVTTNLYPTPSFEAGVPVGIENGGAVTVTQESGDAFATGTYCIEIDHSSINEGIQFIFTGLTPGPYQFSFDWWYVSGDDTWQFMGINYPEFSEYLNSPTNHDAPVTKERIVIPITATTSTGAIFYLNRQSASAGCARFDAVQFEAGSEATDYLDGSLPDTSDTNYAWTGAPHASTSTRTIEDPLPEGYLSGDLTITNPLSAELAASLVLSAE